MPTASWMRRPGLVIGIWLLIIGPVCAFDDPPSLAASFEKQVAPFLKQRCVRCHNEEKLTSGIRVDHLTADLPDRHLKLWQGIQRQIKDEAMPPETEPQPTPAERQQIVDWIDQALKAAYSRPTPKNGGVRRLTVAQYRNTLRELLLLDEELTSALPPDAVSRDGFVNNQETLALSPLLVEEFFEIAGKALDCSLVDETAKPRIQNFRVDLGAKINPEPCPDALVLGALSQLLDNADFTVTQLTARKPFPFEPFFMQTKYRFIEGYQGNDTVRGWRDFDSIYHSVFACVRGTDGYPKGRAWSTVPEGLLLRPAIPSAEEFMVESTYGPRANFKISLRELPDHGRFRVTVTAAKYDDGLLLDKGAASATGEALVCSKPETEQTVTIPEAGVYQLDVHAVDENAAQAKPQELSLQLGATKPRHFVGLRHQPAFLIVRLPAGPLPVLAKFPGDVRLDRIAFTRLNDEAAKSFLAFEQRAPRLGVHLGLRRDCGSTLNPVGSVQTVTNTSFTKFVFEGAIRNFPSPDVEADNVNYLAGIREIGVRSEYTDGRDMPRLLVCSVEFEGPLYESWPPPSHRNILIESDQKSEAPAYSREVLRSFANRAFRRPVTDAEGDALFAVFTKSTAEGAPFLQALKDALQVVLTSPRFLMLIEQSSTPEPEPLTSHELASKLSYFLWNGPPDATTLKLASEGTLHTQLDSEVTRLIGDARFSRFTSEFGSQWLALEKFAVVEPDRAKFPKLTRDARTHLAQEPVEFLQYLVRENLPLRNLVQSDFVLANEVVASYYDLAEKPESGFAFVPVKHNRRELGGVLAQAAILAGLSDGRESNPVKRGAWLARRIIAEPPDDPPPNVPALQGDTAHLSLRERLERHRSQPGCAQCHSTIDPWGVPFEEFDAGGLIKREPPDARSTLPDKTEIAGHADLKRYLADDRIDQVAFSVLKHLTTYATGRSLSYNELESLRQQAVKLRPHGYRMQDLVRSVVHSPMFLEK